MGIVVEIDGTDGTGKTTLANRLVVELARRGISSCVVPSAKELLPGFEDKLRTLAGDELLELEARGYQARRQWAGTQEGFCFLDRGALTLRTSAVARMILDGTDDDTARLAAGRAFARNYAKRIPRYLVAADAPAAGLALFWEREPERVSPDYFEYQALFLELMAKHPVKQWRRIFPAVSDPGQTARQLADDLVQLAHPHEGS